MIKLTKGTPPDWIVANQVALTSVYRAAPAGGKPSPWRNGSVLTALRRESNQKCIYCEGFPDDVAYAAVEHIRPKHRFPELILEWSNLGLACTRCNTNKGSYWSDDSDLQLLNPYVDAVHDHIEFAGPLPVAAHGSSRGANTLRILKLAREELVISRMRRIQEVDTRIKLWHDEVNPEMKLLLADDLRDALNSDQEFSAALTAFAVGRGFVP